MQGGKMDDKKYDALRIENQLCFPLYAASREVIKQYKPFLDEIGLTYTQYITMMVLWEKKTVTVKELGEGLYLDSGTLTPLLKKMELKGLVVRRRSDEDERNLNVSLTQEGERLKEKAVTIPVRMGKCLKITPQEAQQLYQLLYKLLDGQRK